MRALFWLLPFAGLCAGAPAGASQDNPNSDTQIQKDFLQRVDAYVKLRETARQGLGKLKPTKSPEKIKYHERSLAHAIRELRRNAQAGDIFTPGIATDFRRLIGLAMQGADAQKIVASLRRAEPVHLKTLRVNRNYPEGIPLQSTPPTLLANLPKLPPEIEYRVVGRTLVLLDVGANMIVDFIPNALPARTDAP